MGCGQWQQSACFFKEYMLKSRSISRRLHVHPDTALLTRICHVQGRELLSCAEASANRSISIVSRPARHLGTFNPNVGATDRRAALHCFCMKKNASGAKGERERGGWSVAHTAKRQGLRDGPTAKSPVQVGASVQRACCTDLARFDKLHAESGAHTTCPCADSTGHGVTRAQGAKRWERPTQCTNRGEEGVEREGKSG